VLVVDASIVGASVDGALVAGPAVDDEQPSANRPAPPIAPPMKLRLDTAMPAKVRAECERAVKDKRPSQSSLAPNRSVERRAEVGQGEQLRLLGFELMPGSGAWATLRQASRASAWLQRPRRTEEVIGRRMIKPP